MKNLHVLPTDKPSRLSILNSGKLNFGAEIMSSSNSKPQHIYITSDEEIKVGDWCYNSINNNVYKKEIDKLSFAYEYKIILTTDQDLIKDSVQKINDEFLEWFVKNPSCEEVEVDKNWNYPLDKRWEYKIIIPKEEQKQHLIDIMRGDEELGLYEEPKQETLEEAAEKYARKQCDDMYDNEGLTGESWGWETSLDFKEGAKWQAERMYSKEDLRAAWMAAKNSSDFNEWFEQFKNK
jgi:hypothetical protein